MAKIDTMIISYFLLLTFYFHLISSYDQVPAKTAEQTTAVVVEGLVYCQSCQRYGTWSLSGAEPIPAAKVSVICKDYRNHVSSYKAFETDANRYFYAQLEGFKMGHDLLDHPLTSYRVKLVSSPQKSCNLLTNVNYGLSGSPLRYKNKRLSGKKYEAMVYAVSPLAFRPAHCIPKSHP